MALPPVARPVLLVSMPIWVLVSFFHFLSFFHTGPLPFACHTNESDKQKIVRPASGQNEIGASYQDCDPQRRLDVLADTLDTNIQEPNNTFKDISLPSGFL